jgi:peptide/nickel transport system substrate-binding protein
MGKQKRVIFYLILSVMILSLLAGCNTTESSTETSNESKSETSTDNTNKSTEKELVVDLSGDAATLDPGRQYNTSSYTVYRNIFDNLLRRDSKTLEIIPWVAESWEQTSPTAWEFVIREGIQFHNGEPLQASDVVFSLERILDPAFGSPQFANFSTIKEVETDGSVVTITTHEPSPTLLTQLVNLSVVPESYVKEHGNDHFNLNPVGSGAYILEKWDRGNEIVLNANPDYWKGEPSIKKVVFRAVPNAASRIADLQSGLADIVFPISPDDVQNIEQNPDLKVLSTPTERVTYLAFNVLGDTPTKSEEVRKAIAYGVNYEEMMSALLGGYGDKVNSVLTPFSFGYIESIEGYEYNPEKAKELLNQAGYSDGLTLDFATSPAYDQRVIQAVQGDLSKIGIEVNIVNTDHATYLQNIQSENRNWGSIRMGNWSCACLDADGTIYPLFRTGSVWSSYSNEDFDKAVDAARTTTDESERLAAYENGFKILHDEVPGIGLWQLHQLYGASKNLNWKPDAQESFFVQDMEWVE